MADNVEDMVDMADIVDIITENEQKFIQFPFSIRSTKKTAVKRSLLYSSVILRY